MRICSLIPSGTEILYALGLGDQVIGVTDYCLYPTEARSKPKVSRGLIDASRLSSLEIDQKVAELMQSGTGTYFLDARWLEQERPDLILSQGLCRVCDLQAEEVVQAVEALGLGIQVLELSPSSLGDILDNIRQVGRAMGHYNQARELADCLQARVDAVVQMASQAQSRPRVLCFDWIEPATAAGHWVPEMVTMAGGIHGLTSPGSPARRLKWQEVIDYAPEVLFLIPCAMDNQRVLQEAPTLASNPGWWELPAVRSGHVYIAYSDLYSVPGPRIVTGLGVMAQLLHPRLFKGLIPEDTVLKLDPAVATVREPQTMASFFHPFCESQP